MEGWLEKEGHNFKSWKRRYMVLSSVPSSRIMEGGYGGLSSMLGGGGGGDGADKDPSRYIQRYENNNPNDGCQIYYLSYYKDINKRYKCGEILITKNTAISNVLNGHIPGRINLFAILSTENKGHNYLLLSALTEDEKISWMQTIQTIIDTQVRESDYYQIINQSNLISNINNNKIEGWLEKEGQFIKSWKRRWMVFDPQLMLLSYSVEMDSIFKKGEFKLSNKSTIAPLKNGFVPGKMNLFVITSTFNRESILLSALTPEDRDRWISGIQKYLLKHQKRQTNYSTNSLISFPVNGVLPCTVEDIRTIQLLFSDILTAPPNLMPFADLTVHMRHVELFLSQYFSNEYVEFYGSYDLRNKTSFLRQIENWWFTIPDMRWSIQDIVVDGNKVAVWMIIRGSPHGTFYDLTDLDGTMSFTIMGLSIFTFVNSQIKSTYHLEDWNDALEQIKIATIKNKSRPSTHIPTHSILSISPSKLSPEIMLSRTPTTGDRVMSVSLRDSSYADILSSLNVPSPERIREMITTLYTSCLSVTSSGGSLSPTESLSELLSLDYTSFSSSSQTIHREEYLHQVESWKKSIPDIRWSIQDLLIDGNKVAVRLIVSGSPKGDFMDLHDLDGGVSFAMMALSVHMIINNQIKCSYNLEDWESALSQIARVRLSELSVSAAYSFCL